MAPERSPKRQKTSQDPSPSTPASQPTQIPSNGDPTTPDLSRSLDSLGRQAERSSWYASWSRKATPVTQVASETIKSVTSKASEVAASIKDGASTPKSVRSPSLAMTLGKGRTSRASLAGVATTMVHAEGNGSGRKPSKALSISNNDIKAHSPPSAKISVDGKTEHNEEYAEEPSPVKEDIPVATQSDPSNPRSSWFGWLAQGDGVSLEKSKDEIVKGTSGNGEAPSQSDTSSSEPVTKPPDNLAQDTTQLATTSDVQAGKKGWFPMWGAESVVETSRPQDKTPEVVTKAIPNAADSDQANRKVLKANVKDDTGPEQQQSISMSLLESAIQPPRLSQDENKASGWAFWARDRKENNSSTSADKPREGEIAISDTPSQNQPRRASISVPKETTVKAPETTKNEPPTPKPPKAEPKASEPNKTSDSLLSTDTSGLKTAAASLSQSHKKQGSKSDMTSTKVESSNASAVALVPSNSTKPASIKSSKTAKHLLLPDLHGTLTFPESPSLLMRLANLFYTTKEDPLTHLSLSKEPPHIKNALAIGVHGYFPAPLIRSVLGQPTGTSIKFADMAAKSIKRWTNAQGYECEVKTAALEGEGKIAERVELLWKLLLNWIEEVRKSDFIMVACHSQGVPVAIMLVAKLIQFGCVGSARICICAMAGVNMGPFQEYKSRWIGGSAGELFDFSDATSRVSSNYLAAMDVVLKFGVRLTFIGSIDDQLVSLESSVFAPISHPHIFRAVSIDAKVHAPNFLSHLVGFAFKLRNLGIQDHGLIRELSSPLAGSLYTGEGHSRIYEDDKVYDLAVAFAMETTAILGIPLTQKPTISSGGNPYILPFAMRGILEEDFVKNELSNEASDLLREFDEWKPTSKVLKDVKFRLEGIRSKI